MIACDHLRENSFRCEFGAATFDLKKKKKGKKERKKTVGRSLTIPALWKNKNKNQNNLKAADVIRNSEIFYSVWMTGELRRRGMSWGL